MGGVAGVAVDPHARGHGVATALIDATLPAMRERGQVISALYPSVPPLYRARGWEQTGNYERVEAAAGAVRAAAEAGSRRCVCGGPTEADLPALHDAYLGSRPQWTECSTGRRRRSSWTTCWRWTSSSSRPARTARCAAT